MELRCHPSSVTFTAPLARTADRTFRSRTFCSRRGRAAASPNPLFVASQQYPQQLNMMWYRKECDFKCQQLMNNWGAKILLSCRYPQQWYMYEANEIHTSEIRTDKRCFLASVISASGYTLVTTTKHSEGWSKPKMATESPRHLYQSLAGYLFKRAVRNISNYINFLHFSLCFQSSLIISVE